MKKTIIFLLLFGISIPFGKIWGYLTSPTNCIVNLAADVVDSGVKAGKCVYSNVTFQA